MDINWPQVWTLMIGVGFALLFADLIRWAIGSLAGAVSGRREPR